MIDQFNNNSLDPNIYIYQLGNGFFVNGSWIAGWGNNGQQYYTGPGNGYAKNYNPMTNTTENAFIENEYLILSKSKIHFGVITSSGPPLVKPSFFLPFFYCSFE